MQQFIYDQLILSFLSHKDFKPFTMKFTTVLFTAVVAVVSVKGAALPGPNAEASAEAARFCWMRGMACGKLRRAVDVASTILAEVEKRNAEADPTSHRGFCFMRGMPCGKAKRAALALEEAIADARNFTELSEDHFEKREPARFCWMRGMPCGKTKRDAEPEAEAEASPEATAEAARFCWMRGQPCGKVKRAVEEIKDVTAEQPPQGLVERDAARFCWMRGMPCGKAKRALDHLEKTADEALNVIGAE